MSAETKAALEAALQAHINDESEDEEFVTGYVLQATATSFDAESGRANSYWFYAQENQPVHVTLGLASMLDSWAQGTDLIYRGNEDDG